MPSPIIEVKNVSKSYGGVKANVDITLDAVSYTHLTLPTNREV